MHANKREEIKEVYAGDIAAAVGLKSVTTGDTICDEKRPVVLESMDFPEPVISLAIEPRTKADQEKLAHGLGKLMAEDPTFRVKTDRRPARSSSPAWASSTSRSSSIASSASSASRRRRPAAGRVQGDADSGGRGRKEVHQADRRPGPVWPREDPLYPGEPGEGYEFDNQIVGGTIPEGIHQAD